MFRGELKSNKIYVIDFIETQEGKRFLRSREVEMPSKDDIMFSSKPYDGRTLSAWRAYNSLEDNLEIEADHGFHLDALGEWMSDEEHTASKEFMRKHIS